METLQYLEMIIKIRGINVSDGPYRCIEDFVLRHGQAYEPAELPGRFAPMQKRQCFYNCTMLALEHADLTYVEGYARNIIPTLHAWCVDSLGRVIDPTWDYDAGHQYYGVPFSRDYLRQVFENEDKKFYGLLDSPETGWPLITGKHTQFRQAA
jgi:hypothetical protein